MKRVCQRVLKKPRKSSIGNMSYRTAKTTKNNLVQQSQIYWSGKNKEPLEPRDVSALKLHWIKTLDIISLRGTNEEHGIYMGFLYPEYMKSASGFFY